MFSRLATRVCLYQLFNGDVALAAAVEVRSPGGQLDGYVGEEDVRCGQRYGDVPVDYDEAISCGCGGESDEQGEGEDCEASAEVGERVRCICEESEGEGEVLEVEGDADTETVEIWVAEEVALGI